MMLNDNCKISYGAWNSSCVQKLLKISHEITKISVLAGNSYGIVPLYTSMRLSSHEKGCLFWDFQVYYCGKARVRL